MLILSEKIAPPPRRRPIFNEDADDDAARKEREDDDSWVKQLIDSLARVLRRIGRNKPVR
jgi:hypothetical protein